MPSSKTCTCRDYFTESARSGGTDQETHGECWVQDVVQVDRKEVEEAFTASRHHGVARVVDVCPGIGALGQATIGQKV